jgi:hypothetical protein
VPPPADQLSLRLTLIGGETAPDDWQVIWDGIPIGRILKAPGVPVGRPNWSWGVIFPHKPQLAWQRGLESDLAECQRRFKVAWYAVHAMLSEADIEAARHQAIYNKRWKT